MRKHISQYTKEELAFVHGYIRANASRTWSANAHFYDRANARSFTLPDAQQTIANGLVIEVHNERSPDIRALVRSKNGTCAVVSLKTWEVITVYYNSPDDKHYTLNRSLYRWPQNLVQLVKSLRENKVKC
jgi:hypothetical protein